MSSAPWIYIQVSSVLRVSSRVLSVPWMYLSLLPTVRLPLGVPASQAIHGGSGGRQALGHRRPVNTRSVVRKTRPLLGVYCTLHGRPPHSHLPPGLTLLPFSLTPAPTFFTFLSPYSFYLFLPSLILLLSSLSSISASSLPLPHPPLPLPLLLQPRHLREKHSEGKSSA